MAAKKTGLAAFTDSQEKPSRAKDAPLDALRTKGKGEYAHITLRLTHDQWEKVHQLSTATGVSINKLAIHALSRLLEDKGLPGL